MARCSAVSDWWAIIDVLADPLTCVSCPPPRTVRAQERRDDSQVRACTGISLGFSPLRTRSTYPVLKRPQVVGPMPPSRSLQRLEVAHHGRNKLRHGRMNVHRTLHPRVRRLCIHNVEDAVNDLVTCESQEGGTKYLFAISIHQDFHEAIGLASLTCATDVFHCQGRDQRGLAGLADFRFRHAHPAKWRIGVESGGSDALARAP